MNSAQRLVEAYRLVDEAAARLTDGNDPASGYKLLHRAAVTGMAYYSSPDKAAEVLELRAASLRQDNLGNALVRSSAV